MTITRRRALLGAALLGIAVIVVLITALKVHPFLALVFGGLTVGVVAGVMLEGAARISTLLG